MAEESSNPFLGKPISLVTKAGLRYEGKLYTVVRFDRLHISLLLNSFYLTHFAFAPTEQVTDDAEPSVTLSGVRVKNGAGDASASEKVFAFITFKTSDIEDLNVLENADASAASAAPEPAPSHAPHTQQRQMPQQQPHSDRHDAQGGNRGGRGGRQGGGRNAGPAWHEQPHPNPNPIRQSQQQQQQHSPGARRAPRNGQFDISADASQIEALKSQLGEFNFEESNSKFAEVATPAAAPAVVAVKPVYVKDDFFDCLSAPAKSEDRGGRNSQQRQVDIDTFGEEALANRPRAAPRRGGGANGRRGGGRGGQRQQFQ